MSPISKYHPDPYKINIQIPIQKFLDPIPKSDEETYGGRREGRKGDGETLVDMDGCNMEEAAREKGDEVVGRK